MSNNKSAPRGLDKYVVVAIERPRLLGKKEFYAFGRTQKEAKERALQYDGKRRLFAIRYDYYGDV